MTRKSLVIIALLICTSCGGTPYVPPEPSGPNAAVQTKTYQGVGIVKGLTPEPPSIVIDHQEIQGLMPAMEMEFHVSNKSLLDGLVKGDRIDFSVENSLDGMKVVAIKKSAP